MKIKPINYYFSLRILGVILLLNIKMANLVYKYAHWRVYQKKLTHTKNYQIKPILDTILWLIENYLSQKKLRSSLAELSLDKFESMTIIKIKKLANDRSKSLRGDLSNVMKKIIIWL